MVTKKNILFILTLLFFLPSHSVIAQVEQPEKQEEAKEKTETKKQKVLAFLKNHKKKIGTAIAIALILYFFGDDPGGPPRGPGNPPGEFPSYFRDKPAYLSNAGLKENFIYYNRYFSYHLDRLFLHRLNIAWWKVRYIIFLMEHHPRIFFMAIIRFRLPERVRV